MKIKGKTHSWMYYVIVSGIFLLGLSFICAKFSKSSLDEASIFAAYQIFAILIPGLAYTGVLKQDEGKGAMVCLFIAYALGYSSNIAMYYIMVLLGGIESNTLAYFFALGIQCVFSVIYLIKKKVEYKEESSNWVIALLFIAAMFAIELFTYSGYNMLPPYTDGSNIWKDIRYWIGNTVSLKINYPPVDFRSLRSNYGYHFFSSIQLAVESIVTGIPVARLSISFSFVQAIIIVVGGIYCLADKYVKKSNALFLLFFLLLLTSGYEGITRVSYVSHMYMSQYGFDYGIGFMLFLLLALCDFFENKFSWQGYCFMNIIFTVLMGIKSPFACVGIVGIGFCCAYFLIKGDWRKAFIQGISILGVFIFLYFNVCSIEQYSGTNASEIVDLTLRHWDVCENLENIRNEIFGIDWVQNIILEIVFWGLFIIICNPCLFLFAFLCLIVKFIKWKKMDCLDFCSIAMIVTGISIALYMHMGGKSNVYFAMATYPVAFLATCRSFPEFGKRNKLAWIVISLVTVVYGGNLFLNHAAYDSIIDYWKKGRNNFELTMQNEDYENTYGVSKQEYEALCYARMNVNDEEILLSINGRNDDRNLAGIFAEHKTLNISLQDAIEGRVDLDEQIDEYSIEYLIVPLDAMKKLNIGGNVLFENEQWKIIQRN